MNKVGIEDPEETWPTVETEDTEDEIETVEKPAATEKTPTTVETSAETPAATVETSIETTPDDSKPQTFQEKAIDTVVEAAAKRGVPIEVKIYPDSRESQPQPQPQPSIDMETLKFLLSANKNVVEQPAATMPAPADAPSVKEVVKALEENPESPSAPEATDQTEAEETPSGKEECLMIPPLSDPRRIDAEGFRIGCLLEGVPDEDVPDATAELDQFATTCKELGLTSPTDQGEFIHALWSTEVDTMGLSIWPTLQTVPALEELREFIQKHRDGEDREELYRCLTKQCRAELNSISALHCMNARLEPLDVKNRPKVVYAAEKLTPRFGELDISAGNYTQIFVALETIHDCYAEQARIKREEEKEELRRQKLEAEQKAREDKQRKDEHRAKLALQALKAR